MTAARWVCSVVLVAEFVMAPINLWRGRTMRNFRRFTGLPPRTATTVFAPLKLLGAVLVALGLAAAPVGAAGAVLLGLICAAYLLLLAAPGRRDAAGIAAFVTGLACSVVVLAADI